MKSEIIYENVLFYKFARLLESKYGAIDSIPLLYNVLRDLIMETEKIGKLSGSEKKVLVIVVLKRLIQEFSTKTTGIEKELLDFSEKYASDIIDSMVYLANHSKVFTKKCRKYCC